MKFFALLKGFKNDESGAVTVDWVVLTAAIVGLSVAVIASLNNGTTNLSSNMSNAIAAMPVGE